MRCDLVILIQFYYIVSVFCEVDNYSILSIPSQTENLAKLVFQDPKSGSSNAKGSRFDCAVDRSKSLLKKSRGDNLVFVPLCNPKNSTLYQSVQCYDIVKHCFCVNTKTGEPIPGSNTSIDRPRCPEEKPTKKTKTKKDRCNAKRRTRFLKRLVSSLKTETIMAGNISTNKMNKEAAVQWKFDQLDKNKNKMLERFEWKPYKMQLLQWKKVRHCSRNLFKYCDSDGNKKLTQSEWIKCIAPETNRVPAQRPEQLNPFLYILKPE